ncbi:MAG TPA: sulfatase, partial [Nocardioidaceae bacterium]|nr:sulfatase [Nocardioidaceae bacterium]
AVPVATGPSGAAAPGADPALGPGLDDARPNIVVIMADDMRADEVAYMPNLQRLLGEQGVTFENSFSPHPLCCPARASFLSGQYTHNHEVWWNGKGFGFRAFDDSRTFATALSAAGYNTAFLGKYLNGYGVQPPHGERNGVSSGTYVPPGWTDWRGAVESRDDEHPDSGSAYRYYDTTLNDNGTWRSSGGKYQTRQLGDETTDMLSELTRSPKPFLLWASYLAPHTGAPREADDPRPFEWNGKQTGAQTPARPPSVRGMFDDIITDVPGADEETDVGDKPRWLAERAPLNDDARASLLTLARQRAESLQVLDSQVGRTVHALERAGELDNTLVVFTSDNGFLMGEHRILRGKILPYEPSLRVPTLMRGPGIPAGQTRTDPVSTIDFAPTLLAAAGVRPDLAMDGVSVLDTARDGDRGWDRAVFTETGPWPFSDPDYWDDVRMLDEPEGPSPLRFQQGLRTPRWFYSELATGERELYDLRADPGQLDNIVDRPGYADQVRRLARQLDRMRDCAGPSCARPMPASLRSR